MLDTAPSARRCNNKGNSMRLLLVTCLLVGLLAGGRARSLPEDNPFLKLLGLAGSGNSGGWNPLALLGLGAKKDDQPDTARHFASIANGVNGLFKDVLKGAAKLGEETTSEATTTKDPIADGIGKLIHGFLGRKSGGDKETTP